MADTTSYEDELNHVDYEALVKASRNLWFGANPAGVDRYSFYRRKGYSPDDALSYALAWSRNATEQAARRKSHETGCPV
jgi:hypothetical protein